MRRRWRAAFVGGAVVGLAVLGGIAVLAPRAEPPRGGGVPGPALMATSDTAPVRLRVGDREFVIPSNYFRHPPSPPEEDSFLPRVLLPDLEPYTAENADRFSAPGFGRKMNILVHPDATIRPLEEVLRFRLGDAPLAPPSEATHRLAYGRTTLGR